MAPEEEAQRRAAVPTRRQENVDDLAELVRWPGLKRQLPVTLT